MSIDRWLSEKDSKDEDIKREQAYKKLSEEEVQDLKKKKVRDIVQKKTSENIETPKENDFLYEIIKFNNWLNQRTYLKGDFDKIEMWIKNLYSKMNSEAAHESCQTDYSEKRKVIDEYKKIPPQLLDEKIRIALNKKIHGGKKTSSDNYYLRKLKAKIKDKLLEAKYYEILYKIINF